MLNASPKLANFLRKSLKKIVVDAFPMGFWWSLEPACAKWAWFILELRHIYKQGRVFATVTRNMFGLRSLVNRFREFGCAAMTSLFWPKVNRSLWSVTSWFQDGGL